METICPTSPDVAQCAEAVCDQHLPNQLHTVANTLAYALKQHGVDGSHYGNSEAADSVTGDWAAEDWSNFLWLSFYGFALAEECEIRFGNFSSDVAGIISSGQVGLLLSDHRNDSWDNPQQWFHPKDVSRNTKGRDLFDSHRRHVLKGYAKMTEQGQPPTWTGVNPPLWVLKHAR